MNQLEYHIDLFPGGEDLLGTYRPFQYTVIFLDIYMDGISGIETAEKIREADEDANLVFLTASEEHRPEAFSVFATAYLIKPCTLCIMLNGDTFPIRMKNAKELEKKWLNYKFTSIWNTTASHSFHMRKTASSSMF